MINLKRILLLTAALFFSYNLFSATIGTLTLEGIVAEVLSIEVIPSDGTPGDNTYSGLDLHNSVNLLPVAEVREISNTQNGYKVLITHDGLLENAMSGTTPFAYGLFYNNVQVQTGSNKEVTNVGSGGYNSIKSIKISYTGIAQELLVAGTYTDTVTFTIEAN